MVSFPSAKEAGAFFTASAQSWPACADRKFTLVTMGTNMAHTAGPVSNTDGTLSITQNQDGAELTFSCQRALTVANNIVVDIMACSLKPTDAQVDSTVHRRDRHRTSDRRESACNLVLYRPTSSKC